MIIGFGIDAVDISRIQRWIKHEGLLARFFHPQELAETKSRGLTAAYSLAARFAAKEAYGKALGTGLKGITLKNILVTNNPNGKPELTLFGDAAIPFKRIRGTHIHLSLTHESNMAIAGVILESEPCSVKAKAF
ncbi:4'-phosphopantetheinyl transferase [Treponema sp. OMZ 838]|uniref:holo-ACP synthase n=1 Tax=Treponema sp. OMZ 838 TaxID=1539298 RepID=UPI00053014AD|nr:holo-ACP synthase [Treponema sp. OMZ 838]AIW90563.1 4'-phosphopantetheinyl transferase [Treponema sp. OMZ 838]